MRRILGQISVELMMDHILWEFESLDANDDIDLKEAMALLLTLSESGPLVLFQGGATNVKAGNLVFANDLHVRAFYELLAQQRIKVCDIERRGKRTATIARSLDSDCFGGRK